MRVAVRWGSCREHSFAGVVAASSALLNACGVAAQTADPPRRRSQATPAPLLWLYPDLVTLAQHSVAPGLASDHALLAGAVAAASVLVSDTLG